MLYPAETSVLCRIGTSQRKQREVAGMVHLSIWNQDKQRSAKYCKVSNVWVFPLLFVGFYLFLFVHHMPSQKSVSAKHALTRQLPDKHHKIQQNVQRNPNFHFNCHFHESWIYKFASPITKQTFNNKIRWKEDLMKMILNYILQFIKAS